MGAIAEPVPDCFLVDTDAKLTPAAMRAAWAAGARGLIRYVGFGTQAGPGDIDAEELAESLAVGFGVMLAQHVREPLWHPSALMGETDAIVGARHAKAAGYIDGATLWDDLEGIGGTGIETIGYANAKCEEISKIYSQGEYIGDDVPLDGHELFASLLAKVYWRSLSRVPDVAQRGYAMVQMQTVRIGGVDYDVSYHTADRLGGRATWMRLV